MTTGAWSRAWGDSWGLSWGLSYEANQDDLLRPAGGSSPATTRHVPARRRHTGVLRRNPRLEEVARTVRRQAEEDILILLT